MTIPLRNLATGALLALACCPPAWPVLPRFPILLIRPGQTWDPADAKTIVLTYSRRLDDKRTVIYAAQGDGNNLRVTAQGYYDQQVIEDGEVIRLTMAAAGAPKVLGSFGPPGVVQDAATRKNTFKVQETTPGSAYPRIVLTLAGELARFETEADDNAGKPSWSSHVPYVDVPGAWPPAPGPIIQTRDR
jgi:hypothetical protein